MGKKPSPEYWSDMMDEDEDFHEELQLVYTYRSAPESNDFTPEVIEGTYLNMEMTLTCDGKDPEFSKVKKR